MMHYVEVEPNHSQYEGENFNYGEITEARYVKPLLTSDRNNKYIAALPVPPDKKTVFKMNIRHSDGYNMDNSEKSDAQKMLEISKLQSFRVPLPSVYQLWTDIYQCLEQSYSRRTELKSHVKSKQVIVNGKRLPIDGELVGADDSAVIGFYMIGQSGCGKTSALRTALNYYPKVIRHTNEDGTKTIQIPYLFVTCAPNSNFRVLYANIGRQLDRYLGNPDHDCEKEIIGRNRSTLGEMLKRVESMIERYAIGLIVFDEVQLIDFVANKENSFNALMTMANETLVGIGMAGTNEALHGIAQLPQIARRIGFDIPCDSYITDENYFNTVMKQLEKYQWYDFKERISFTDSMKHEIFMASHGIIAYVVLIYMIFCMDYVNQSKAHKPEINLEYLRNVIEKYFHLIKNALENRNITAYEREIAIDREVQVARTSISRMVNNASESENAAAISSLLEENESDDALEANVVSQINSVMPDVYNDEHIREAFRVVRKRCPNAELQEMTYKVIRRLMNGNTDKRKLTGKKSSNIDTVETDAMRTYVMNNIGDPNNPLSE